MKDAALKILYVHDNQLLAGGMHAGKVMKGGYQTGPFFLRALCSLREGAGMTYNSHVRPTLDTVARVP